MTTFIASNDMTIFCENNGTVEFKKGDHVFLEHDGETNVFLSRHEDDGEKVHAFEVEITDADLFENLLNNLIVKEEELDDKISYEELSIDVLISEEEIDPNKVIAHLAEVSFKKKPAVRGGKVTKVRVPVSRVKKKRTAKQKQADLKRGKALARDPKAKKNRAKSMKIRKQRGIGECGYMAHWDRLFNETHEQVSREVLESLSSCFEDKAKVSLTKENDIEVNLFNISEEVLVEALDSANVHYVVEGEGDSRLVKIVKPAPSQIVESYYSPKEEEVSVKEEEEPNKGEQEPTVEDEKDSEE